MTNLVRDALHALRLLRKAPGFTAVAVLTLALGIAADTAVFSVVYAVFLAPLPYREPERLVAVFTRSPDGFRLLTDAGDFAEWRRRAAAFEDLNAWSLRSVNLAAADRPEHVEAGVATPGLLAMMGYGHPLALGRDFLAEEGVVGRDRVAILSHRLWRTRLIRGRSRDRRAPHTPRRHTLQRRRRAGRRPGRSQCGPAVAAGGLHARGLAARDQGPAVVRGGPAEAALDRHASPGGRGRGGAAASRRESDAVQGLERQRRAVPEQLPRGRHEGCPLAAPGYGHVPPARRLRQRGQSPPRARGRPPARARGARLTRRVEGDPRASARHGGRGARTPGREPGRRPRLGAARCRQRPRAGRDAALGGRRAAEPACPALHAGDVPAVRHRVRQRSRMVGRPRERE